MMNKKTYLSPLTEIVDIHVGSLLNDTSETLPIDKDPSDPITDDNAVYSRRQHPNIWDDEEHEEE